MHIAYMDSTCSMGELGSIYLDELLGPDDPVHPRVVDEGITFVLANTSCLTAAQVCKFLGFKPLTKYNSNDSHQNRKVIVWGREMHRDSPEEHDFIDRQIYAKAMRKITGYRSDWRKYYAKQTFNKQEYIKAMTERMELI